MCKRTFGDSLTSTDANEQHRSAQADGSGQHEQSGTVGIEDGTDLDAAAERKEDIDGEDPADGALVILLELVIRYVSLEYTDCVHQTEAIHKKYQISPVNCTNIYIYIYREITNETASETHQATIPMNEPNTTSHATVPPSG